MITFSDKYKKYLDLVYLNIEIREFTLFPFLPSFKGYYCKTEKDLDLVLTFIEYGHGTESYPEKYRGAYDRTFKGADWYFTFPCFNEPNYYDLFFVCSLADLQTDFDLFLSRYAAP